jgi:hypothetical protein
MYINDEEQGGSVLNNLSQDANEEMNKSIEIHTTYVHTPNNNVV